MRFLVRDLSEIKYKNYTGKTEVMDGTYHTGEYTETYGTQQTAMVYVAPDKGFATTENYGVDQNRARMIVSETDLGISKESIVTIESIDYKVIEVMKSFHHTSYRLRQL